jgi:hypothetical protein
LYNYTAGSPPNSFLGVLCIILAFLDLLCAIGALLERERSLGFIALLTVVVLIPLGILSFQDTREERIKATVDDSASWKEIRDQYELLDVEGSIYTFRVIEQEEN